MLATERLLRRLGLGRAARAAARLGARQALGDRRCLHAPIFTAAAVRRATDRPRVEAGRRAPTSRRARRSRSSSERRRRSTPAPSAPAVDGLSLEVPAGEICVLVGPSGCGKTTAMRMANRMVEITEGDDPDRRPLGARAQPRRAAARDRLRDPADRPLPAPHDRREHRHGPAAARLGPRARARRGSTELLELIGLDPELGERYPVAALRRPAAAGRRRPGARREPGRDADGRAVRRRRPDQPRAAAERVPAPAGRASQDDPLRHPRHRRGDQDGRPDRDPARRAASSPSTRPRPSC